MSSPLAIGAVSAVLRNLLDNGMIEAGAAIGGTVNISAVAPDMIDLDGTDEPPLGAGGTVLISATHATFTLAWVST